MDLYCPKCGEPWDNDSLHDEAAERQALHLPGGDYRTVLREFQSKGCTALAATFGPVICSRNYSQRAVVASALYDLLGDDADGAMSMMEDFGF